MTPYEHLKNLCAQTPPASKILIVCQDIVRRTRALDYALGILCSDSKSLAVQKYDGSALNQDTVRDLRDSSLTLSLFSSQKFIVLKNVDKLAVAPAKELELVLKSSNQGNTFLCTASAYSSRSPLANVFDENSKVEFPKLQGEQVIRWTAQELKRQGFQNVDSKVIKVIATLGSEDLDQIASLVDKLLLYCDGEQVTAEDVESLDRYKESVQEFEFVNLLAAGKKTAALAYIEQLHKCESSAFPLLGLVSKMFSNYLRLSIGKTKGHSDAEISKDLGLSPWAYRKQAEVANKNKEQKLLRVLMSSVRADSQLKNRNLGENAILTELITNAL